MSRKPSEELEPLDLSLRARADALLPGEAELLERALATSAALRTAHAVGHDLDTACRVQAGDQALIARALKQTLETHRPPVARTRRLPRVSGLLAVGLTVASAAAATGAAVVHFTAAPEESAPAAQHAHKTQRHGAARQGAAARAPAKDPSPTPSDQATAPEVKGAAEPDQRRSPTKISLGAPARSNTAPVEASLTPSAEQLLLDAGAARAAGNFAEARDLYRQLQRRFPGTNEATVSFVSLGKLLLGGGDAKGAAAAFRRYLSSGAGGLREEALVGQADALAALGRVADEKRARQELLRRYPGSIYARAATTRLAEIENARHEAR